MRCPPVVSSRHLSATAGRCSRALLERSHHPALTSRHLAFVVGTKGEPVVVPLGAASVVDALIAQWRFDVQAAAVRKLTRATDTPDPARMSGARLRRAIWDSIAAHVDGATTLFVYRMTR